MTAASTRLAPLVRDARLLSQHQRVLRLVVLVAPPLVLLCATGAGARPRTAVWAAVLLTAVLAAAAPQSLAPGAATAFAAAYWALRVQTETSPWALVAAVVILVMHAASALAALGPPGLSLDAATRARWARRVVAVAGLTALVWVATRAATGLVGSGSLLLTAAALAALAAVLASQRGGVSSG